MRNKDLEQFEDIIDSIPDTDEEGVFLPDMTDDDYLDYLKEESGWKAEIDKWMKEMNK